MLRRRCSLRLACTRFFHLSVSSRSVYFAVPQLSFRITSKAHFMRLLGALPIPRWPIGSPALLLDIRGFTRPVALHMRSFYMNASLVAFRTFLPQLRSLDLCVGGRRLDGLPGTIVRGPMFPQLEELTLTAHHRYATVHLG